MHFDFNSENSIPIEMHPRMAWIYWPPANCRRRGTVGLRGVSGTDAATKPPWMGLRRPRKPTVPRIPRNARCCFGCCFGCCF
ncbi:hypothetical protein C1750_18055 [Stenotrophomonas pavanii]|nr:hypothetical protein C1750_18055 [Stenotrophomonas pavanii]